MPLNLGTTYIVAQAGIESLSSPIIRKRETSEEHQGECISNAGSKQHDVSADVNRRQNTTNCSKSYQNQGKERDHAKRSLPPE